jgi:glycosyltransferase involved in cell wall biosynthesis
LLSCDFCVSSDERVQKRLKALVPKSRWDKFSIIPNGFDADDFSQEALPRKDGIFTIAYVGTIYRDMPPSSFLQAVANLIEKEYIPEKAIKIIFIGAHEYPQTRIEPAYQSLLKKAVVDERGMLTHRESIRQMQRSDALLLISTNIADSRYVVPSKIYEYLAAGKPLIGLVDEDGVSAEIIRRSNSGYVVPIGDINKIEEIILAMFNEFNRSGIIKIEQNKGYFRDYERKNTCGRLAKVFEQAGS